jgi:hypothetical protein
MKVLMRKKIGVLSGALTSILIILSWVAIFAGIFENELNVWLRELWESNQTLLVLLVAGTVLIPTVLAILVEISKDPDIEHKPPDNAPAPRHELSFQASKLGKSDPQLLGRFVREARQTEIDRLCKLLLDAPSWWQRWRPFRRVNPHKQGNVAIVTGIGGIGKTTLALYVAYLDKVAGKYRTRLYLDLKGLYQTQPSDEAALRQILSELDMYPETALQGLDRDKLRNLYQQYLEKHKSHLILVDNPTDNTPLEALIPPPGCGLVIIARPGRAIQQVAASGRVRLEPLSKVQAREVLKQYWTEWFDPAVADTICELCSYVPLALVVAGKTIVNEQQKPAPERAAERFAQSLAAETEKRPGLASGFFGTFVGYKPEKHRKDIQTVLSLSYKLLEAPAQRLFRALATFGRLPFDAPAAISVAFGVDVTRGHRDTVSDKATEEDYLQSLLDRGLIFIIDVPDDTNRYVYQMYDLLYEYARYELAHNNQHEMIPCLEPYKGMYHSIRISESG